MSLETTYLILRRSKQSEAADALSVGVSSGDATTRERCIETLAYRCDSASHRVLTRSWSQYSEAIIARLETQSHDDAAWFGSVISLLKDPTTSASDLCSACDIASRFHLTKALPRLIELARNHDAREVREAMLDGVVSLSYHWGKLARNQYAGMKPSPTLERERVGVMEQFDSTARDYQSHRSDKFIDAMLMLATWNDPVLLSICNEDTPSRQIILRRMRSSKVRGIVVLLAGYLRRKTIPESVVGVIWQRADAVFREYLLRAVSVTPSATILHHFQEFGLPECLRGGVELAEQIDRAHDASLAQAYSAAMAQNPETLLVILELIDRQWKHAAASRQCPNEQTIAAFAQSLHRCQRPSMDFWLQAMNSPLMDGDVDAPQDSLDSQSDRAARICRLLIDLSLQEDSPLAQVASDLLSELTIQQALPHFCKSSPIQRVRLGRTLIQIDGQTIAVIQDGLRHAVMQRRLEAIDFAKTLGLVDLMFEPLSTIARGDHQIVRMAATEALADAQGEASADLLRELCNAEQPSLRDAAREALQARGLHA
ncbi:hypothetical protein Pla100_18170 [Neorhodopirellula pilleata]|uniref:HEAT repeat protein n=2 Tax=Neorhodopirellula pilleata TaxID=2714738 RepID=A0A5C6ARE8_9BACT|nr:hypothetical protein Pla100_18170 [Neorhodopirellula pilleata]